MNKELTRDLVLAAVALGVLYFIYKKAGAAIGAGLNAVAGAPAQAGVALSNALYTQPNPASVTYIFTFPDGSRHAVNNTSINASGQFSYQGVVYIANLATHVATPVTSGGNTSSVLTNFVSGLAGGIAGLFTSNSGNAAPSYPTIDPSYLTTPAGVDPNAPAPAAPDLTNLGGTFSSFNF